MIQTKIFNEKNKPTQEKKEKIINFLYEHLEEYGDPKPDITKAVNYALKETKSFGGFILVSYHNEKISGVVVLNQTGMKDYIPENILVYIATHKKLRGRGIGKQLIQETIKNSDGNIALHVEPENPAKYLYEKVGFSSKYIEMRYKKEK